MNNEKKKSVEVLGPEDFANKKTPASSKEDWGIGAVVTPVQETEKKSPKKAIIIAVTIALLIASAAALVFGILNYKPSSAPATEKTNAESTTQAEVMNGEIPSEVIVVEVPEFKGKTLAQAEKILRSQNIEYEVFEEYSSDTEKGRIISQSIDGGTKVSEDVLIHITVSLGEKVTEKPIAGKPQTTKSEIGIDYVVMSPKAPELKTGERVEIEVTVFPKNATKKDYMLVSDNNLVAVVGAGDVVRAVAPGYATVNAYTPDGTHIGSISVTVREPETKPVATRPAVTNPPETRPAVTYAPVTRPAETRPATTNPPATTKAPVAKYKVTFDANGGTVSETSRYVQKDSAYGTLPVPVRNGFDFDGWYTEGGARVYASTEIAYNRDHTLVARWISGWVLESNAPDNAEIIDSKTEYKQRQRQLLFSSDPNLAYAKTGRERWVPQNKTVEVKRVDKWPADTSKTKGFCTDNNIYKTYNKALPQNTESTRYVQQSKKATGYIYWHWCYSHDAGKILNCYISTDKGASGGVFGNHVTNNFHAFVTEKPLELNKEAGVFQHSNKNRCPYTYWWFGNGANQLPVYTYVFSVEQKEYEYEKWGEFSVWSTSYVAESETVDVETRTWVKYCV